MTAAQGKSTSLLLRKGPRRDIRYLAPGGIHPREIKCLTELDARLPPEWTFYAGLQYFPGNETPMDLDLIILMDDRVLLVEIKEWTKKIRHGGDVWIVGRGNRIPSPIKLLANKARKLKSMLRAKLPQAPLYVDSCVVLAATPSVDDLPADEATKVLSLADACCLGDPKIRRKHLATVELTLRAPKAWDYTAHFDTLFGDRKAFRAQEALFDGYRITEPSVFVHPRRVWIDHRSEESTRANDTALLRCWDFSKLPPGLNAANERSFIVERERKAYEHLNSLGSWLTEGSALLRPFNSTEGDVATDHFDLLHLPAAWIQVSRFIERNRALLKPDDAFDTIAELLRIAAELHDRQITHRDFGLQNIWIGSPSRIGITGFSISQLPSDASVSDWRPLLQGYAPTTPEDADQSLVGSGYRRDVYQLGLVSKSLIDALTETDPGKAKPIEPWLDEWLKIATSTKPQDRFPNARAMLDDFIARRSSQADSLADTSRLDAFETTTNPYVKWPSQEQLRSGAVDVHRSALKSGEVVIVKVWPGLRRGSAQLDLALLRLLEGASRLKASPLEGFPVFDEVGLHRVGPFVVYKMVEGRKLSEYPVADVGEALTISSQLLRAIDSLHGLGYSHGDLSPDNILVAETANGPKCTIVDLFDLSSIGDSRKRTIAYCPTDHEIFGERQIDRYAGAKIGKELLSRFPIPQVRDATHQLDEIVSSGGASMLDFAIESVFGAVAKLNEPPAPSFTIKGPAIEAATYENTEFMARRFDHDLVLTADAMELALTMRDGKVIDHRVTKPSHASLEGASAHGISVRLTLQVDRGEVSGFNDLADYLGSLPGLTPREPQQHPSTRPGTVADSSIFPVRKYWQRSIEAEDEQVPEVEITGPSEQRGRGVAFPYERVRGNFDFDPDDIVDVYWSYRTKPFSRLDLKALTPDSVALLDEPPWPLVKGDRLRLVSRKSGQSYDRRRRAVERILQGESQISDLIEYFDPAADRQATRYEVETTREELQKAYDLNVGQAEAMLQVLRAGPLGLLQGPPGTGKTHFIAALVHWLRTRCGADKILLVSQSHEAVNEAIEKLIDRFKTAKQSLELLRIGTKGITEKIRPYHTDSLRERFRGSFEGALKGRVAVAARAAGLPRNVAYGAVDIERGMGALSRRIDLLESVDASDDADDDRSRARALEAVYGAFNEAGERILNRPVNPMEHRDEIDAAFRLLAAANPDAPQDMRLIQRILDLSNEWLAALATRHRNFDEFLAKTRSIIGGTCVGVLQTSLRLEGTSFDWVIIDEAARCTAGELSVAAQLGRRVLLVGDHLQLLPMRDDGMLNELKKSFPGLPDEAHLASDFERAFTSTYGKANHCALNEQYRMVDPICNLIAEIFYRPHGIELKTSIDREADPRFATALPTPFETPIAWLDTSRDSRAREKPDDRGSHANDAEVAAIVEALSAIANEDEFVVALAKGREEKPIGVICMYSAQREAVERAIAERSWDSRFRRLIKVETVDSYQGKENTIVFVSLSRTSDKRRAGHVSIPNRCNVAFSRARERLIVVGSAAFWRRFDAGHPVRRTLEWIERREKKDRAALVIDALGLQGR